MTEFDPHKDAKNLDKHAISLDRWHELAVLETIPIDTAIYGELRYKAYGLLDGKPYCLIFTLRAGKPRPISLRRAHAKEMRRHVP